ncbi:MAG: RDD family protein [Planctomycetota bacterium]
MTHPREGGIRREIVTPEGVPLRFEVAPFGARVAAFLLDFLAQLLLGFAFSLCFWTAARIFSVNDATGGLTAAVLLGLRMVAWFAVWNFYFIAFELRWRGRTPGKRALGIRVIDRHGGELRGSAVCARNFVREIEFWLPLKVVFLSPFLYGDVPGWAVPLCALWALCLMLFPLFNRSRLRLGDLVGGTLVVVEPRPRLMPDLAAVSEGSGDLIRGSFAFTPEQLEIYGIFELQVLEDLLRKQRVEPEVLELVAEKIKRKIDWPRNQWRVPTRPFLEDFYRAQRARLEQKAVFGRRQEYKVR